MHGDENLANVPKVLTQRGFTVREMGRTYLIKNVLRNGFSHPIGFFRAEARTKTLIKALKGIYKVPALEEGVSIMIIYANKRQAKVFL